MSSQSLGPFVIGDRVGTSVWLAEDTRSGKRVAIKLLSKTLPKDEGRRETLIKEVRVAAALYHAFLVPIIEIAAAGDNLLMVMEVVEGQPLTKRLRGTPLDRAAFFRLAYQLSSVVKYLHTKTLLHGNLNGDAVLITDDGQVRLGGLNLSNLVRRERASQQYQQKGTDARCVAYMAPEQISAQTIDEKTDLFSLGTILYEMATGKLPFAGSTAPDIARAIVDGQPVSPKSVHPSIDNAVIQVLGACLFKDPFKRQKDARALVEMIERLDPGAVELAAEIEKKLTAAPCAAAEAEHRRSILFIADVANYDELAAENPEKAARAAARMQQILGEAVYLFDGKVVDPFGTRMVAELPNVESALEAGRKGQFDFSPEQTSSRGERLSVRMLLHAGDLEIREGAAAGPAVEKAVEALAHLTPNTLFISEEFVKEGRGTVRLRDAGAKAGLKLFTIVASEPGPIVLDDEPEPTTADIEAELEAEAAQLAVMQQAARKKRMATMAIAASVAVLVIAALSVMWMRRERTAPAKQVAASTPLIPDKPTPEHPKTIHIAPLIVETGDPALAERANAIRLGVAAILRSFPELRVADTNAPDAVWFSARIQTGAAGPVLVPVSGKKAGAPIQLIDAAGGIRALVEFVIAEAKAQPRTFAAADALNSFATALTARLNDDNQAADTALRAAMQSDPKFLPAQLLAMEFFAMTGKETEAVEAAKQVVALEPRNLDAARKVARASLIVGDLQQAFALYQLVLDRQPRDAEALNLIARYSASVGEAQRFNSTLAKLSRVPQMHVAAHAPDLLAATGRLSQAVDKYYDLAPEARNTPSLSLKIGRMAVLRHSMPLAEDELKKLAQSDPLYGFHLLKAYMAAENRDRAEATKELEIALKASVPGDDSWTAAAEVYAILNDTAGVLASLEKAAQRKEPTAAYVLANPLFKYLESDARFVRIRETLSAQQAEIRTALAQVK
jgi:Tfp pilus assembly protein PilF/tRNA A-37 threonylcarbamoyl transferase component Bud32